METYCINRVSFSVPEKTLLEVQANNVEGAWLGSKFWLGHGTYYVFQKGDYANGTQYTK